MSRIRWPDLMRLGMRELGLTPDMFWDLTPAELMILAGADGGSDALDRGGFEELMRAYPDQKTNGGPDGRT